MRSFVTAIVAAIEAAAVALAGFVVVAIPVLLMWLIVFQMGAEPGDVASVSAAIWLLAHFVPLQFSLDPEAALGFGLSAEPLSFVISLAPLGITLLTVLWAARSGWRLGQRGGYAAGGVAGGVIGFAAVAASLAAVAGDRSAFPVWLSTLLAGLVYGCAAGLTYVIRSAREGAPWWEHVVRWLQRKLEAMRLPAAGFPRRAAETFRLAAAAIAFFLGAAGVSLALAILLRYGDAMALTQQLQLDPLGSVVLFIAQLMLLPVAIVWSGAWLTGAGFSVGIGTSATPFEALLGPVPALPLFGVIPQGWGAFGALAPALLVLGGVWLGVLCAKRPELRRAGWAAALAIPACAAIVTGLAVALLALGASGAIGPDRLQATGAQPWLAGGLAALEIGAGLILGVVAARADLGRVRAMLPESLAGGEVADKLGVSAIRRRWGAAETAPGFGADEQATAELSDLALHRDAAQLADAEFAGVELTEVELAEVEVADVALAAEEFDAAAETVEVTDLPAQTAQPTIDLSDELGSDSAPATGTAAVGDTAQIDEAELVQAFAWEDQDLTADTPTEPPAAAPSLRRWLGFGKGQSHSDDPESDR